MSFWKQNVTFPTQNALFTGGLHLNWEMCQPS